MISYERPSFHVKWRRVHNNPILFNSFSYDLEVISIATDEPKIDGESSLQTGVCTGSLLAHAYPNMGNGLHYTIK